MEYTIEVTRLITITASDINGDVNAEIFDQHLDTNKYQHDQQYPAVKNRTGLPPFQQKNRERRPNTANTLDEYITSISCSEKGYLLFPAPAILL